MAGLTGWIAAALGAAVIALMAARLIQRRRVRRLAERIEDFLVTSERPLDFSVREDSLAPLHNAAAELENRLTVADGRLREEYRRASDLTADISHQLKTPLASLKLFCELDGGAHLEGELRQIERMEALISALLRLERLRADGYEFSFAEHRVEDIVGAAWDELAPVWPHRRLEIRGGARLRCDAKWMGEAFRNLLKNACEHTDEGGLIRVSLDETSAAFFCTVEDDGGGVAKEDLRRLFERFYHAPGREGQGAGIGLAIVQAIIRRHHGTVRAENGDKGLKIIIDMPKLDNIT